MTVDGAIPSGRPRPSSGVPTRKGAARRSRRPSSARLKSPSSIALAHSRLFSASPLATVSIADTTASVGALFGMTPAARRRAPSRPRRPGRRCSSIRTTAEPGPCTHAHCRDVPAVTEVQVEPDDVAGDAVRRCDELLDGRRAVHDRVPRSLADSRQAHPDGLMIINYRYAHHNAHRRRCGGDSCRAAVIGSTMRSIRCGACAGRGRTRAGS